MYPTENLFNIYNFRDILYFILYIFRAIKTLYHTLLIGDIIPLLFDFPLLYFLLSIYLFCVCMSGHHPGHVTKGLKRDRQVSR